MRFDWNSLKALKKKRDRIAHVWVLCLLMTTMALFGRMPAQAAPIIDTTMIQTGAMPGAPTVQTTPAQTVTNAQIVSTPGSGSVQTVQTSGMSSASTLISTGTSGVGELWMLGSTTGAQNLSIVIKSPNGKIIVIDGGWEADADKLSSLILQQGGKVDAWLITHPHEDHVGALCAILNDASRKIRTLV